MGTKCAKCDDFITSYIGMVGCPLRACGCSRLKLLGRWSVRLIQGKRCREIDLLLLCESNDDLDQGELCFDRFEPTPFETWERPVCSRFRPFLNQRNDITNDRNPYCGCAPSG